MPLYALLDVIHGVSDSLDTDAQGSGDAFVSQAVTPHFEDLSLELRLVQLGQRGRGQVFGFGR